MEGARPKKVVRVTRAGASAGSGDASSAPPSNSPNNTARNTDYKTNDVDENKNGTPRDQPVETPRSTRADATPVGPTQVVQTVEEGNALVKRLRQLESENASLSNALTKVCDENVKLAGHVSQREARYAELVSAPLASTSVLHSLFEPEKTGWFGGSKSAAREKLEQLAEELQSEFLEYRASHASTNDEVQALLGELQSAHANAQKLSAIVHQQQEAISRGPLAVTVRIASGETDVENISLADLRHELERRKELEEELRQELRRARDELQAKTVEIGRQQHELQALRPAGGLVSEREQQHLTDEIARLEAQVTQLRDALATEEQLHGIKLNENKGLTQRLKEMEEQLRIATSSATEPPAQKEPSLPAPCKECEVLQQECDAAQERVRTLNRTIQRLEAHLAEVQQANEKEVDELQRAKSQLEEQLMSRVPRTDLAAAEMLNKNLQHELDMAKARVKHVEGLLERERGSSSQNMQGPSSGSGTLDDAKVLEALERNKERISRLEFQRQQLTDEATQLREAASAKEEELVRAARATQEDKQRINFLLKRCVTLTNDLKSITAARDELSEQHEHSQLELSKLRRQGQELVTLQQRIDDLKQKNEGLQSRLSCVEELENELVKAKETVAYMELAQSRSINMSQFAELQAKNTKLENTLEPIKRQLEEAKKELERIKTENESLHAVMARQQNAIKTHEEQAAALHANDAKLREKMNQLSADNTRLRGMNDTLEAQMSDMQDGIKEMAVKLEQERGKARAAAETTYRGEIAQLQAKLNVANETLAGVRSAQDAFVPRGIHDALAVEKERLEEDNKRKVFDLDKLKSEILIYRQTIDDLEAENEEHLRQVEGLQSTHKKERAATADRLTAEQKKLADANKELDGLRTRVEEMTQREERLLAQQKEMEEAAQKHRRAFEDKCRQEEKLLATVAATNREMEVQREELQRVATQQKKEAEVAAGAAEDLRHREDECQALQAELRRAKEEKAANERDLAKLRDASKGSGSCGNAAATAVAVVGGSNSTNSSGGLECCKGTTDPAVLAARAEQLQMSLIQAQQQLVEEKQRTAEAAEVFGKALDKADAETAALQRRVQQLEDELKQSLDVGNASNPSAPSARPKKKKSAKKDLSVMAHLGNLQETDVLTVAAVATGGGGEAEQQRSALAKAERELQVLHQENVQLKERIAALTEELHNAHDDLELATSDVDKQTVGLREQIRFLELQLKNSPSGAQAAEARLRSLGEENRRLQAELESLAHSLQTPTEATNVAVQRLKEELRALAKELVPTKNKLVEYMAMADRLGIQYPFSADMEGTAVVRLKAMHFDTRTGRVRASSAPRQLYASDGRHGPPAAKKTTTTPGEKKKRRKRREGQFEDGDDLR